MAEQPEVKQTGSAEEFGALIGRHWKAISGVIVAALAGGWLVLPASQTDMKTAQEQIVDLRTQVGKVDSKVDSFGTRIETAIERLAGKLDSISEDQHQNKEDIVRLTTILQPPVLDARTPAMIPPAKPKKIRVVRRKTTSVDASVETVKADPIKKQEPTFLEKVFSK